MLQIGKCLKRNGDTALVCTITQHTRHVLPCIPAVASHAWARPSGQSHPTFYVTTVGPGLPPELADVLRSLGHGVGFQGFQPFRRLLMLLATLPCPGDCLTNRPSTVASALHEDGRRWPRAVFVS
jgi:hypothetical protein